MASTVELKNPKAMGVRAHGEGSPSEMSRYDWTRCSLMSAPSRMWSSASVSWERGWSCSKRCRTSPASCSAGVRVSAPRDRQPRRV